MKYEGTGEVNGERGAKHREKERERACAWRKAEKGARRRMRGWKVRERRSRQGDQMGGNIEGGETFNIRYVKLERLRAQPCWNIPPVSKLLFCF